MCSPPTGRAVLVVIAYTVRIATLPLAMIADWIAAPILRLIAHEQIWWVVEVRFRGWDAEFVRIAEATTEAEVRTRLDPIENASLPVITPQSRRSAKLTVLAVRRAIRTHVNRNHGLGHSTHVAR